jgi:hypothetical protein
MNPAPEAATSSDSALRDFFNSQDHKILCTANRFGEPSVALMGTPRLTPGGLLEFEISDVVSTTLDNLTENPAVALIAYYSGARARDFGGVRIYARVDTILRSGPKLESIRDSIRSRHGEQKASELQATVSCSVTRIRPVVDRGQQWNEPPFPDEDLAG